MAIEFACPACGGTLRVDDDAVGQVVRCGGCMTMLRVPDASGAGPARDASQPFPEAPSNAFPEAESAAPQPPGRPEPGSLSPRDELRRRTAGEPRPRSDDEPRRRSEDEPRRPPRRRRSKPEPPPPTGRSPMFWVLITLCVLGLGSCVLCCGLTNFFSEPEWRPVESQEGGFKVELPTEPRHNFSPKLFRPDDKALKVLGTRVLPGNEEFMVFYKPIERIPGPNADEIKLNAYLKGLVKGGISLRGNPVERTVDGFPARQFEFQDTQGGQCVALLIVADRRLYLVVAGVNLGSPQSDRALSFLDSFQITDPNILAAAEQRKDGNNLPRPQPKKPAAGRGDAAGPVVRPQFSSKVRSVGREIGNAPFPIVFSERTEAMLKFGAQVATVGRAVTAAPLGIVAAERQQGLMHELGAAIGRTTGRGIEAARLSGEVAGLGAAASTSSFRAVEKEQAVQAEAARVHSVGVAVGKAAAAAAAGGKEKP